MHLLQRERKQIEGREKVSLMFTDLKAIRFDKVNRDQL